MNYKELGTPNTVGELRELLNEYDDNIAFGFRNQPMQKLTEYSNDGNVYVSFQSKQNSNEHQKIINSIDVVYEEVKPVKS